MDHFGDSSRETLEYLATDRLRGSRGLGKKLMTISYLHDIYMISTFSERVCVQVKCGSERERERETVGSCVHVFMFNTETHKTHPHTHTHVCYFLNLNNQNSSNFVNHKSYPSTCETAPFCGTYCRQCTPKLPVVAGETLPYPQGLR